MKCLSICRSIHARCTTEKYGDVFSCRFSIRTRKWETTRGLFNIPHTAIFYPLFSMRGSTGSFTGDGYLRCIRRDLALYRYDFFHFFHWFDTQLWTRVYRFVRKCIWFSLLEIRFSLESRKNIPVLWKL